MSLSKAGAHRHQLLLTVSLFLCHVILLLCALPSPSHSYSVVVWSERPHHCWYPIIRRSPPVLFAFFFYKPFSFLLIQYIDIPEFHPMFLLFLCLTQCVQNISLSLLLTSNSMILKFILCLFASSIISARVHGRSPATQPTTKHTVC